MVDSYFFNSIVPQTLRRYFILREKESRIYAGSGVSQTPKNFNRCLRNAKEIVRKLPVFYTLFSHFAFGAFEKGMI